MQKDPSPIYGAGYGLTTRDSRQPGVEAGVSPDSSFIARALHDHPFRRFMAESAASLVGMEVAGALVKKGGVKIGKRLLKGALEGKQWQANVLQDFRKTQSVFDRLQGVDRLKGEVFRPWKSETLEEFNRTIGNPFADQLPSPTGERAGFFITQEEKARARATGQLGSTEWALRDELQQRLVRQARRLPYELPALYVTQRGISDRILGKNEDSPNWHNPVDVIGDFARQSMKNTFGLLLPFEAGKGAASHGVNRFRSMADETHLSGLQQNVADASVSLRRMMGLVGHDVGDLLGRAVSKTERISGSMQMAIQESAGKSKSTVEKLDTLAKNVNRGGVQSLWQDPDPRNLPGYLGDLHTFYNTFKTTWKEIGQSQAKRTKPLSFGDSRIEELTATLRDLEGGLSGTIGKRQLINEYREMMREELKRVGVSHADAQRFMHQVRIRSTSGRSVLKAAGERRPETFFEWGAGPWAQGETPFGEYLGRRLTGAKGIERPDVIAENIEGVLRSTDRRFASQRKSVDVRVQNRLGEARAEVLRRAPETFKDVRPGYANFAEGAITPQANEYLLRQTARLTGIPETADINRIRGMLSERGFDPDDTYSLRGFLTQNKKIAKPGSAGGFNAFGLRKLSAEGALKRGYFGDRTDMIKKTLDDLEQSHGLRAQMRQPGMRGVYETSSGGVVDLGVFRRKFWRSADLVANEAQIPYIHFRPLQAAGYQTFRSMREGPAITVKGAEGRQPFLGGAQGEHEKFTDLYVWTKQQGLKGKVSRVAGRGRTEQLEGLYRDMPTDESTFVGRSLRQAIGDMGRAPGRPPESREGPMGWFKRAFAVDEDQPDSMFRLAGRWGRRKNDPRNFMAMAKMALGERAFPAAPGDEGFEHVMKGTGLFLQRLRQFGIPPRVIEELSKNSKYKNLFNYTMKNGEVLDFAKAQDAGSMRGMIQRMLDEEDASAVLDGPNVSESTRNILRTARQRFNLDDIVDEPVSSNVMSPTISRRIDQFRREIYQYLQVRQGLLEKQDVNAYFGELLSQVDVLKSAGRVTRSEATEFRTALLSTQVTFEGFKALRPDRSAEDVLRMQLSRLTGRNMLRPSRAGIDADLEALSQGRMVTAEQVLPELAAGGGGSAWRVGARKAFGGIAPYEYPGTRYDPFGGQTAFVPTFGTAFRRDPKRAVASALGWNTWKDPDSFSGAGIPLTHGFTRLNRYFSGVGLGLDTTQFNGPLDLYARGMIGRRVLPVVAGGATALAVDRQIGGMVNERDPQGRRVYSPFFTGIAATGVAEAQIAAAGVLPGGETAGEKEYELYHGEVTVRKGRWWPLGNQPWKGGNEQYFRPSWYRRLKSGYQYTDQTYGSPMERLAFGHDFSPLRPLDPYRFERKHYKDRPYPISGDYFTGPWGPITPALNMTVGRLLKPRITMHDDEVAANMANYTSVGEAGMAPSQVGALDMGVTGLGTIPLAGGSMGGGGGAGGGGSFSVGGPNTLASVPLQGGGTFGGGGQGGGGGGLTRAGYDARSMLLGYNDRYLQYAGATGSASRDAQGMVADNNSRYLAAVGNYSKSGGKFPNRVPFGMTMAAAPQSPGSVQMGELGFNLQETLGIYGFAFASARESLGMGEKDFIPPTPVLASPSTAYGSGRTFWDFNLGGLGDSPLPVEGEYANLEFGEIIRRFVPKPRRLNVVNPIVNQLAVEQPWLPATFKTGDPFTQVPEGEMRLPGIGYERTHPLAAKGEYGLATQFSVLGDVAPWSDEYRQMERSIDSMPMTYAERREVEQTKKQTAAMRQTHDFRDYEYKHASPELLGLGPVKFAVGKGIEHVRHADNYFTRKFGGTQTATEDWERNNVYGQTFPQWQNPIEDYLKPMIYRATNRSALGAAAGLSITAGMMWRTTKTKRIARFVGGVAGLGLGSLHDDKNYAVGKRWIPKRRREELQVEEYSDILNYTKWKSLYEQAASSGQGYMAANFRRQLQKTMYGADLFDSTPEQLAQAVPKRKREHFLAMVNAPEQEHQRILSTAPRLERRLYEASWGMKVEQRPDLEEYFTEHELPAPNWEGWNPATDMEQVKLKMIQSQGLDAAQMGYYPQQVQQANLINMSYPNYRRGSGGRSDVQGQLQALMAGGGASGNVVKRYSPFPGIHLNMSMSG